MGVIIALTILLVWFVHLCYLLIYAEFSFASPFFYLGIILQTYFYTGLFITAHDAMHKTVSRIKWLNKTIGYLATFLYAGMSYNRLIKNHFLHHKMPGTNEDPDFNVKSQNFFVWWGTFMIRYTTITQLIIMGTVFNILKLWVPELKLWFYWVVPALFSSLQLFFFGTYLPHRKPHSHDMEPHKARTQKKNHIWAMISCYFFGYHFEHHELPNTPWWKLYQIKS
ncbi:MAG: fatty acid desaturase [Melioribacteraceae bacterium]|nr:fatty acid desaturase [Melioribacteraceae bacterium]